MMEIHTKCALFSWKCYLSNLWNIYNSLYVFFWFGGKTWLEYVFLYNDNRCCWYLCWDPDPSSKLQTEFSCFTFIGRLNSSMCTTSATPIRSTCRKRAEQTQRWNAKMTVFHTFYAFDYSLKRIHYCILNSPWDSVHNAFQLFNVTFYSETEYSAWNNAEPAADWT